MKKLSQKTHSSEQKIKSKTKNSGTKKNCKKPISLNSASQNVSMDTVINNIPPENNTFHQEVLVDESAKSHLSKLEPLEDKKGSENSEKKLFLNNLTDETVQHITNGIQVFDIVGNTDVLRKSQERISIDPETEYDSLLSAPELSNSWHQERESFLSEISNLQKSLKAEQDQKNTIIEENEKKMKIILDEKTQLELQYRNFLGKLSTIKQGLEEKLKADSESLASNKKIIDQLKDENQELLKQISCLKEELFNVNNDCYEKSKEIIFLNERIEKLEQEWANEKDILYKQQYASIKDVEKYKKLSEDWKEIALEERMSKNDFKERLEELKEKVKDLENLLKQKHILNTELEKENTQNRQIIDEYEKKINEVIENHQNDIKQVTGELESQIGIFKDKNLELENYINKLVLEKEENEEKIKRLLLFEKEIKEKNLLIGKLKHEAVILNEHLVKTLKLLRKDNSEESIDKKLVTNLILSFITLPKNDTKRYEVLQLMSAFLHWTDEEKEHAGLIKSKNMSSENILSSFNFPLSPLSHDFLNFNYNHVMDHNSFNKKSMSDLWISFLQNEATVKNSDLNK
ncbi:uncharacterized protein T551_01122 [Pneumocystis jirovecii RU7]|uniref:GRIP domain-containing protein n=1 Tax=Pneumocystis jirovecii (strain RU7) TaxID=1408657 RepID=A0A0W4ZTZ9_PNEJ7|nr:uncharacterized protein T551_01122 [Pneumocystis jirovecii RU7]KTW31861.1 hypothetical protein T551_01122 [Pneumocystis jirovecii RU7]